MFSALADLVIQQVTDTLGMPAVFQYQGGDQHELQVFYEKSRDIYDTETGVVVGYSESVTIRTADLPALPKQKDLITVNTKLYEIIDVDPDDIAKCILDLRLK